MIFDSLARIVDTYLYQYAPLVRALKECALFVFDKPAHQILRTEYEQSDVDWLTDNYYLPFRHVALEDPASVVVLSDPNESKGINQTRGFIECTPLYGSNWEAFRDGTPEISAYISKAMPADACAVTYGSFRILRASPKNFDLEGTVYVCAVASKKGFTVERVDEETRKCILRNASAAAQELVLVIDPQRFIVESTPRRALEHRPKPLKSEQRERIPRSDERPTYTVLTPGMIRKTLGEPDECGVGSHASPVPHKRMAHTRLLSSSFYRHKQGQRVVVRATYVGPLEKTVGNRRYRVLVDCTSKQ